jgi:hypothetical protein
VSEWVYSNSTIVFDPSDKRVVEFDWDAEGLPTGVEIDTSTWTITAIKQSGVTALTNDNSSIAADNRSTLTRLLATTATVGDMYWVSNKIVTNENPVQEIEQRFKVLVQDH